MTTNSEHILNEDNELEFELLVETALTIGNKLAGHELEEANSILYFAEGLGQKIVNHILSAHYLYKGYQLQSGNKLYQPKIDFSSIAILTRAALETYLTLNYIFVAENNAEVKEFRFKCWDIAGYLERASAQPKIEKHKAIQESELIEIQKLRKDLSEAIIYKHLSSREKDKVNNGQWRINDSWSKIAVKAGFQKSFFDNIYKFLCAYSHSSRLSIIQIQQNLTIESQKDMAIGWIDLLKIILAKHIYDYIEIMPQLSTVKSDFDIYHKILFWKEVGEKI